MCVCVCGLQLEAVRHEARLLRMTYLDRVRFFTGGISHQDHREEKAPVSSVYTPSSPVQHLPNNVIVTHRALQVYQASAAKPPSSPRSTWGRSVATHPDTALTAVRAWHHGSV